MEGMTEKKREVCVCVHQLSTLRMTCFVAPLSHLMEYNGQQDLWHDWLCDVPRDGARFGISARTL